MQHREQSKLLEKAKAEHDALVASIESEDMATQKKQEELKEKDKEIAATRETLVGEMNNVDALKETIGVEKIELERTLVGEVVVKLKEVLSLLGEG